LIRLDKEGDKIIKEERLLQELEERIRDVKQGADGLVYILTDSDNGSIFQVKKKK
jgi:glucose/arabinose dehydrogenase